MDALHLLHFGLLCGWGGVVLAELIVEGLGDDDATLATAARAHFWIDVLVEVPLLLGVLASGGLLLARVWPPTPLLALKVAAGLVAIGLNLYCVGVVVLRHRGRADPALVRRLRRRVQLSAIGVPFGVVALVIGLAWLL